MIQLSAAENSIALHVLKLELQSILDLFDRKSSVYYVDYPVHGNVGDLLINLGTEQFFMDFEIPIYRRYSVWDIPELSTMNLPHDATFLCHGGGNFGDLYGRHQGFRERLVAAFPTARIIFLPQSLHYSSPRTQRASLERIAKHRNCHILVRDHESLETLQTSGITESSLMPDMAHQLWGIIKPTSEFEAGRTISFFRRDREARQVSGETNLGPASSSVDWSDVVSTPHKAIAGGIYWLIKRGGRALPARLNTSMWYAARDTMIQDAIVSLSHYDTVSTNRLHAMLLALLLGRDVNAFDNSYGKLTRYIDAWLTPSRNPEPSTEQVLR